MQQQPPYVNFCFGNPGLYNVNFKLSVEMNGQTAFSGIPYQPQQQQYQKQIQFQNQGYGTVCLPQTLGGGGRCRRHNITPCYYHECQEEEAASRAFNGGVPSNSWSYAPGKQHQSAGNTPYYINRGGMSGFSVPPIPYNGDTSSSASSTPPTPQPSCFTRQSQGNKRCDIA